VAVVDTEQSATNLIVARSICAGGFGANKAIHATFAPIFGTNSSIRMRRVRKIKSNNAAKHRSAIACLGRTAS
jgi:hypothetical protein